MGRSYLFECPRCGYKAKVSGRADEGFSFHVQTIHCHDCKALYDAVIRLKPIAGLRSRMRSGFLRGRFRKPASGQPPSFEAALNCLPSAADGLSQWVHFKMQCPVSSLHRIRIWNAPGKCPRCGTYLERSGLAFRIWE